MIAVDKDWLARLLFDARLSDIAYLDTEKATRSALSSLGMDLVARYSTDSAQAYVAQGLTSHCYLVFAGTRVTTGTVLDAVGDLLRDIEYEPKELGAGVRVASGAFDGARPVYSWAKPFIGEQPVAVVGHSLGGWQATYAALYNTTFKLKYITAIDAPKQGNGLFWQFIGKTAPGMVTQLVHGRDPWFAWPLDSELIHGDSPIIWLRDGKAVWTTEPNWAGGDILDCRDHNIGVIIKALEALAERQV